MSSVYDWSTTAANNANSDSGINFAEGQAPSTVNNSARQVMGRVAELLSDIGGTQSAGGSANALTLTAASGFTTYANGRVVAMKATADNTDAATLNVNGIGAKAIRKITSSGDADIAEGEIQADGIYVFRYNTSLNSAAGGWQIINPALVFQPLDATLTALAGLTTAADKGIYATDSDVFDVFDLTQKGRDLLDDEDAATMRVTLGLSGLATKNKVSRSELDTGFGTIVLQQEIVASTTSVVDCSGVMNFDNSIPQSSEGTQVLSGSFTPVSASSELLIEAFICGVPTQSTTVGAAVFRDSGADALVSSYQTVGAQLAAQMTVTHVMSSPGTSATTFKLRAGPSSSPQNFYVNGNHVGTRIGGGVQKAYLRVTEYLAF